MNFEQHLDPELRVALATMPDPGDITVDIPTHRKAVLEMMATFSPPPRENVTMEDRHIPGPAGAPEVFVRMYSPKKRTEILPGVVWIHGGGFLFGHPIADDGICQRFVEHVGCVVVSVDWRLAPENPFPAGVEDCYAALQWMVASAAAVPHVQRADAHDLLAGQGSAQGQCLYPPEWWYGRDEEGTPQNGYKPLCYPQMSQGIAGDMAPTAKLRRLEKADPPDKRVLPNR